MAAAGACFLILTLALTTSVLDQHFASRLAMEGRRFRALADATFEGLIFEHAGQIVDANRAMCELAGLDATSLIGRPLSEVIPGIELRHTEYDTPAEYEVRLPDGKAMPVEHTVAERAGPRRTCGGSSRHLSPEGSRGANRTDGAV